MYVKGSPEKIADLSLKHTIPKDFERILGDYTQRGFRVLALGYKSLKSYEVIREKAECDLTFLGLVIM